MKLLIADDEKNIRNGLLSLPWNTIGIDQTYQAENGLEALEILKKKRIDIVISDIKMPGLSGLELAEYVSKNNLDTAVVLLWSYVKKKYKLNVPNFHVPAGQVSLQEPQQILPLLSDILLRTD